MVDFFSSVFNSYKSKVTNPFFGTLITVWIIRNWSIVYAFFMFDKDCTMQNKIDYINEYFGQKDFKSELTINLGSTFGVLIFSYILLSIGRSLSDFYYKRCEPWIVTKIDKKAIYTQHDKLVLESRVSKLLEKVELYSGQIYKSEKEYESLSQKHSDLKSAKLRVEQDHKSALDSNFTDFNLKQQESLGKIRKMKTTLDSFDTLIHEFNELIAFIQDGDPIINFEKYLGDSAFSSRRVSDYLILKNYMRIINNNLEYTLLGKAFVKFYRSQKSSS